MKQYPVVGAGFVYMLGLLSVICMPRVVSAAVKGSVAWYLEQESGSEPFKVRYIVTPDYLRSDEGGNDDGYMLFLRAKKRIYNVVPEDRTILDIQADGALPASTSIAIEIRETAEKKAPSLEGKAALMLELLANGELCQSAVVVPGVLDDMREALGEFQRALAIQQQRTLNSTPEEFRTPCFMANYIYSSDYHLERGIPLLEWKAGILYKELLDYETDVDLADTLFELPQGYRHFSVPSE